MRVLILVMAFVLLIAVGAALSDMWSSRKEGRKKQVKKLQGLMDQLENEAIAAMQVDPYDLTAHRVADLIRKTNRELNR